MAAVSSKVREIFDRAAEIASDAERAAYLDTACAGDANVRRQVDVLLKAYGDAGSFLDHPALAAAAADGSGVTEAFDGSPAGHAPSTGRKSGSAADAENGLPFLTPPTRPDSLGWLGHYEVLQVIGRGGFGVVLRAFDERLHRVVAVKVLAPAYAASGAARARFIREAKAVAAIKNEHVVGIHDVQGDADPPYFVMEFVDGISLQDKLDKDGTLGVKEILRIGMQIAEGLAAAHKQGLVHRDIKPANILLENGVERVKITDFGLARAVDDASLTQSGTVAGTPMYMSPEQAEGVTFDHRSDLFSLGTVLYAMCTGHPPFRATSTHAVLKRVIDASPRPIREINNEIPDWLETIIAKLHAKKPEDRFRTATEVAELLRQRLADVQTGRAIEIRAGSVSDGPTPTPKPVAYASGSSSRRRRRLMIGAASLIFLSVSLWLFGERLYLLFNRQGQLMADWSDSDVTVLITSKDQNPRTSNVLLAGEWIRLPGGAYSVEAISKSGQEIKEITFALPWLDGGMATSATNPANIFLGRGDRVTVRVPVATQPAVPSPSPAAEAGWVKLFNGKDLTGWKTHPDQPGNWRVENGAIVGATGAGILSHLYSERGDFGNFHLRVKAKINASGDSGVHFRCAPSPEFDLKALKGSGKQPFGYEANIGSPQVKKTGGAGSLWWLGANDANIHKPGQDVPIEPDEWFMLEIIAHGQHIVTKVKGKTVVDYQDGKPASKGHVALQAVYEHTRVYFQSIEIKELPPEAPGWVQLFNGKDLTGWKTHPDKPGNWRVERDILIGSGPPSHLFSERADFENFHLRAQAKINKGGNSGVLFHCNYGHDFEIPAEPPGMKMPSGYEIELASAADLGAFPTGTVLRLDPQFVNQKAKTPSTADEAWFTLEIVVRGNHIVTKVNGEVAADFEEASLVHRTGHLALQVHRPETNIQFRKIEIKELPPGPTPFILLGRDAKTQQKFATLGGVVKAAQSGDTIEIRGDGPFSIEPISNPDKALTIRAGSGCSPVLRFDAKGDDKGAGLFQVSAPLVLEGLTLEMVNATPWDEAKPNYSALMQVVDTDLCLANCRLESPKRPDGSSVGGTCIGANGVARVQLRNCLGHGSLLAVNSAPGAAVTIDNCVSVTGSAVGINFLRAADFTISVRRSTLACWNPLFFMVPAKMKVLAMGAGAGRIDLSSNVVTGGSSVMQMVEKDAFPLSVSECGKLLTGLMKIQEKRNLYSLPSGQEFLNFYNARVDAKPPTSLADWQTYWDQKDTESTDGQARFKNFDLLARKGGLTPDDFRLLEGSAGKRQGLGGKDLGADVDLVGPGPAYESWKQTSEYFQWRMQVVGVVR